MILTVRTRGLREFRREIKKVDRAFGKELRQAMLKVARLVTGRAQAAAPASAAGALKGRATQRAAFIRITPHRGDELAVFLGQKQRSGWYGHPRYRESAGRQHRPWVGNQWDPGETGGKPYFIGDSINDSVADVIDLLGDEIETLAGRAFT